MDEIEVGGFRVAFERRGSGPPLVLLHGWPVDSREWRRQLDGLSDEFTVVAWDAPGAGRSKVDVAPAEDLSEPSDNRFRRNPSVVWVSPKTSV